MAPVLHPLVDKLTKDKTKIIIDNQIVPWAFFLTQQGINVKKFNGKTISYSGIKFFGTPVDVFWNGYIEPYLENLIVTSITVTSSQIKESKLDPRPELDCLSQNLYGCVKKIYKEMQRIDQNLKNSQFEYNAPKHR